MLKTLALAAILAASAGAVFAEDAAATASTPEQKIEHMKAKMAERHGEMEKNISERQAEMKKHRDECFAKAQAAKTPEEMKTIRESCHKETMEMREKNREEMKAKMQEMRARHEAK